MAFLYYEPGLRFALADDEPDFPDEKTAAEMPRSDEVLVLQEWRPYFLKFYGDRPDFFKHLPRSPFREGKMWSSEIQKIHEINFHNYVGLSQLGPLRLRVENRKIGDDCFHALLDDIAARYADLVFGYTDPVGHSHQRRGPPGRNIPYVEYLFLRRFMLTEDIEGITAAILRNPHYRLMRETRIVPVATSRTMEPLDLLNTLSRADRLDTLDAGHPLRTTALSQAILRRSGKALFPAEVPDERRFHSYDTHENRFTKHILEELENRLSELRTIIGQRAGGLINPEIGDDLERLHHKIAACLDDPLWREVGRLRLVPEHSPVLQRREGYRQLFRLYALLRLLTRYDYSLLDFADLLETKDTATLYEYWCFFQVKAVLDTRYSLLMARPVVTESPSRQELQQGIYLTYENDLTLFFNWTAYGSDGLAPERTLDRYNWRESSSTELRPDIIIAHRGRRLLFDAKYKGLSSGFYGEENDGTVCTPKPEDLIKMHAYRDAIAGVKGAFALFPGKVSRLYPAHQVEQSWNGIGALALRPNSVGQSNSDQVRNLEALIVGFIEAA